MFLALCVLLLPSGSCRYKKGLCKFRSSITDLQIRSLSPQFFLGFWHSELGFTKEIPFLCSNLKWEFLLFNNLTSVNFKGKTLSVMFKRERNLVKKYINVPQFPILEIVVSRQNTMPHLYVI